MILIGLTGSFGCGKSTVLKMFEEKGAKVISADQLAVEAVARGSHGYKQLVEYFGAEIISENGEVNRKAIASVVFNDKEKLSFLNQVTHAQIKKLRAAKISSIYSCSANAIVVYESPLLFETHLESLFQSTVSVTVENEIHCERLMKFRFFTKEEIDDRLKHQMPQEEKRRRSDFNIDNSGEFEKSLEQVEEIWKEIKKLPQKRLHSFNL